MTLFEISHRSAYLSDVLVSITEAEQQVGKNVYHIRFKQTTQHGTEHLISKQCSYQTELVITNGLDPLSILQQHAQIKQESKTFPLPSRQGGEQGGGTYTYDKSWQEQLLILEQDVDPLQQRQQRTKNKIIAKTHLQVLQWFALPSLCR